HFAFQQTGNDETRKLLMLQNAAFLSMFRDAMGGRGQIADRTIDTLLEGNRDPARDAGKELEAVFAHISGDPDRAAQHVVRYLRDGKSATELMNAARLLVFTKGNDAHDYKFSSAILEDYYHVSPTWRDIYLAANVYKLQSSTQPDNQLIERARAALA
ncbi:MAG: hypothetical protein KDA99_15435, partial [Planctomycetales bacterium]|nr:hypothetical protein [Planctomycetales bacterium]